MSDKPVETQVFYLMLTAYSAEIETKLTSVLMRQGYTIKAASQDNQTCWPGPFASFIWLQLTRQVQLSDNTCASIRNEITSILTKEKIAYINFIITKPINGAAFSFGPNPFKSTALIGGPHAKIVLADPDQQEDPHAKHEDESKKSE